MGPLMGTIGGLTAWISLAFKSAFSLLAMGIFMILLFPDVSEIQIKLISVGCCLVFTYINVRGVKLSGRFQTILVILLVLFLLIYVFAGAFKVEAHRYIPLAPQGLRSVFATAGLIFISFSGTTKVTAIAGEVRNPGRNLPLGIFYSWGMVSVLYVIVVFITVGLFEPSNLTSTFTPISLGGEIVLGRFGIIIMTLAGLLAFISTGNAGLLAASRNPLAMGKDDLLPGFLSKISKGGSPVNAILFTSGIMIVVILFLDLETFVKTASALKLILFIIANLSLIFMREANIHHDRPKFRAPFYPWAQIIGIVSYGFLLTQMVTVPLLIVSGFIVLGAGWYYVYVQGKIKREYAMLHVIERVTGIKSTDRLLEEELREILIERDGINHKWFEEVISKIDLINLSSVKKPGVLAEKAAGHLQLKSARLQEKIYHEIASRLYDPEIIVNPGTGCLSMKIPGRRKFHIQLIRSKKGIELIPGKHDIHALFIVFYSSDEWNRQIHALTALLNLLADPEFPSALNKASKLEDLYKLLLSFYQKTRQVN
jgi:amino acid transporter